MIPVLRPSGVSGQGFFNRTSAFNSILPITVLQETVPFGFLFPCHGYRFPWFRVILERYLLRLRGRNVSVVEAKPRQVLLFHCVGLQPFN